MSIINSRELKLLEQVEFLKAQLDEPQQTVEALRNGEVDAVVIAERGCDPDVYTINRCVRVSELEDIALAIQEGSVDALVMRGQDGQAVFTLHTVQEALRRSEERLRVAVKNSQITVYTTDHDLRYTWIENLPPAFRPEEILGKRDDELLPPEFAAPLMRLKQEALESESGRRGEVEVFVDGRRYVYDLTIEPERDSEGTVIGLICAARDMTQRKLLEEERAKHADRLAEALAQRTAELTQSHEAMRRSEAMAVLGALSSGIAHDLGNLLFPLQARLDVLASLPMSAAIREHLQALERSVEYLKALANRLRTYMSSAGKNAQPSLAEDLVDLAAWCRDTESFYRGILPPSVAFRCDVQRTLPALAVNEAALTQAVYNLVQNAGKAIGKSGIGSTVTLRAAHSHGHVAITVEDDGPGMQPEVCKRCVESSFTTDAAGGGMGLGLSLVRGFVQASGGMLEVHSPPTSQPANAQPKRGTEFIMRLPVAQSAKDEGVSCALS